MGEVLRPPAADLTSREIRGKSDEELFRSVRDGVAGTAMPSFKQRLTGQQIRDVLAYIRTLEDDR